MASTIRGNDNFDSANVGSTDYGVVGTYSVGGVANGTTNTTINRGDTIAGSSIRKTTAGGAGDFEMVSKYNAPTDSTNLSGTWRAMSRASETGASYYIVGTILWVRIS